MLNLFIIGPSGCGKSTQAKLIAEKYGITHFSTGQVFRDEIASGSELGLEAKKHIDQGLFCPDNILFPIVERVLQKVNYQNFIIDGTPRRLNQAIEIQKMLVNHQQDITFIIHLDVSAQEILDRRLKQQQIGGQFQDESRTDNTPEAVAKRQAQYDELNQPILDHFQSTGKLLRVDGNRPIEPIFEDICLQINKLK